MHYYLNYSGECDRSYNLLPQINCFINFKFGEECIAYCQKI